MSWSGVCVCVFQTKGLEEARQQEEDLLEAQSVPMRNYLVEHVMPTLTQGLIECCTARPQDPVDFLVIHPTTVLPYSFSPDVTGFWSWSCLLVCLLPGGVLVKEQPLQLLRGERGRSFLWQTEIKSFFFSSFSWALRYVRDVSQLQAAFLLVENLPESFRLPVLVVTVFEPTQFMLGFWLGLMCKWPILLCR